jgi:hypothetical protein
VRGQGPSTGSIQEGDPQPGEARKQGEITSGLLQEAGFGEVDPWAVDSPKALQG